MAGAWKWYALGAAALAGLGSGVLFQPPPPPSGCVTASFYTLKVAAAAAPGMTDVRTHPRPIPIDPAVSCPHGFDLPGMAERANQAVVRVEATAPHGKLKEMAMATGTIIAPEGFVLTVYHSIVFLASPQIESFWNGGGKSEAEVFSVDPGGDLALLKIRHPEGVRFQYRPVANEVYTEEFRPLPAWQVLSLGYGRDASNR